MAGRAVPRAPEKPAATQLSYSAQARDKSARPAFEDEAVQADTGVWGRSPQFREGAGLGKEARRRRPRHTSPGTTSPDSYATITSCARSRAPNFPMIRLT
ncbi:hypothetical protein GCM10010094_01140 [Streptomyces flaveus]|uniref:Uncharacterized protein n=1 Tax=Streptomyces flaveus TaxID=66370 RepID=A0A917QDI0_9ACTN|nr:hypothetical protein GCM10010094_01140 [Streptomyces flaveus]